MKTILAIALGGALGSVLRYGVNIAGFKWLGDGFPWGTFFVNVTGSFIIGLLTGIFALYWQPGHEMRAFLIIGFLGGYTTFSTYSMDIAKFWEGGEPLSALAYAFLSVIFGVSALFLGLFLARTISA